MDKLIKNRRALKQSIVAQKHLKKAEPQAVASKKAMHPLTPAEKSEIETRGEKGQRPRRIASELGIPYALVLRHIQKLNSTSIFGTIRGIDVSKNGHRHAAVLDMGDIAIVVPPRVWLQLEDVLYQAISEDYPIEALVYFNGDSLVLQNARLRE